MKYENFLPRGKKAVSILFIILTICFTIDLYGQQKKVTGTVTDDLNEALPGVSIVVKGSTRGVITDPDGKFSIEVNEGDVLVISFIGMTNVEVMIGPDRVYNVKMEPKVNEFEEVTVVAFAKQKKESVISSISTVSPATLKVPSSNLTTALGGRMAGIISYQQSGEPGQDNAQFFIRGVTTFGTGKRDPLILIDNVELSSDDLARLNVDDIASFSIMKDATATALYGARGANGVILVTTKEGREGKAKVAFRFENSVSTPVKMVSMADPITYMRLNNEAVKTRNPLGTEPFSQAKIYNTQDQVNPYVYPATDWYNELFNDYTMNQRANLSVSGGGAIARYYIAASFAKDNGILKMDKLNNFNSNIDLKKYTVRSNININLTKSTEFIIRLQGNFDDYSGPLDGGNALFARVMRTSPVLYPKTFPKTGAYAESTHILFGNYDKGNYINPYADMVKGYKEHNRTLMLAQGEIKQKLDFITEGLNARGLVSTTRYAYSDVSRKYNPFWYQVSSYDRPSDTYTLLEINPDTGTEYLDYNEGWKDVSTTNYMELSLDYNREFGKHGTSGMLVFTLQDRKISNAGNLQKSLPYRNMGLSGRFTYSYDRRYFTEFNFGYNGSERFSANERYGFFPSIGLGYIISNEEFWKSLENTISKLKFKFTYGLVGNDQIGDSNDRFFYMSQLNMNDGNKSQTFGREYGLSPNGISVERYANDQITWETARKTNFGFELGLFRNFEIQTDFFYEYRSNILMDRSDIPSTMGLNAGVRANVGEASSRGLDVSVDYSFVANKDFWLTTRANYTYATSRYEVVEEPDYDVQNTPWRSRIGKSLAQNYGYVAERLFVDDADIINSPKQNMGIYQAGDIKYKDINGDGQVTEMDMVFMGFPTTPEMTYGFGFSIGYKNLDMSMFFQGNARVSFWLNPRYISPFIDSMTDKEKEDEGIPKDATLVNALLKDIADSHWSESNRDIYAFWPRLANRQMTNNYQTSNWWMQNGTFFRIKSLEIGYSLPQAWVKACRMESCRVYATVNNLLTFSKFKMWDPEMGGNGLGYPLQRVYNIGLNLNF